MYLLVHNPRAHHEYQHKYSTGDLQEVQNLEEQTKGAVLVLEGNMGVFSALQRFYHRLGEDDDFSLRHKCIGDLSSFTHQMDSFIDESKTHLTRGQLIGKLIAARKTTVRISALPFFACNLHSQCTLIVV